MRGVSLRLKINVAILLAFVAAAVGFGAVLRLYVADRLATAHNRTRSLLAAVAVHRMETLAPLLEQGRDLTAAQAILDRLVQVEGVTEASLFDAAGRLLAHAGTAAPTPLAADGPDSLPAGRVFAVSAVEGRLSATLVEPMSGQDGRLGYLRLRYSLQSVQELNQRLWLIFATALGSAYALMAGLLNLLLHRFVLRPVDTLRQALEAVEAGRLDQAVPVASRDALGRVAAAFNAMAARLRETSDCLGMSRAEVEEQRRLLESRVEARTAELAETNLRLMDEIEGRRRAEQTLLQTLAQRDALLGNSQVGLATVRRRVCVDINPRGAEILGYSREALLGQSTALVFADEADFLATSRDFEARLAAEGAVSVERRLRRRDGSMVWARVHGKTVADKDADQDVVWAFDDITAEKERQARLEQARHEAEEASRAKGAFLAVMSHEIRTPLNAVMGLTELLLAQSATDEQRGYLRTVQDSVTHLAGIISDILDFSKIEAGKLVLERVDFQVGDLLDAVTRVMDVQARQKGLGFSVTVAGDVPGVLRGDPGRLRQVLLNLLGNAMKFTDSGSVSLVVEPAPPEVTPEGKAGLTARIEDTGIGIGQDRLTGLFTNFHQGPDCITRRFGGTGLGLAITKEIVERMGGSVSVRSREGRGSVFTFTVFMEPGDPARAAPSRDAARGAVPAGPRLRILLVEDNALNAAVTQLHLGRMGHDLTVAPSAVDAYEALARETYDVVLMDIEMPDIDGITATRTIRAKGPSGAPVLDPQVPIVAVTAHAVEDVRRQCLDAGMNGFVTKPINYHTLVEILGDLGRGRTAVQTPPASAQPSAALFDPLAAREAMGISWSQYEELSRVSCREGSVRIDEARQAVEAGDLEKAAIAVHTFKGAAATLGAYSCRELAVDLERAVRAGDLGTAGALLAQVTAIWASVVRALGAWRAPGA